MTHTGAVSYYPLCCPYIVSDHHAAEHKHFSYEESSEKTSQRSNKMKIPVVFLAIFMSLRAMLYKPQHIYSILSFTN
jgi:hypothetical protein